MARHPVTFKKADVARAVKAVRAAGIDIARVEIDKDGRIVVVTTTDCSRDDGAALDKEIRELMKQHGKD